MPVGLDAGRPHALAGAGLRQGESALQALDASRAALLLAQSAGGGAPATALQRLRCRRGSRAAQPAVPPCAPSPLRAIAGGAGPHVPSRQNRGEASRLARGRVRVCGCAATEQAPPRRQSLRRPGHRRLALSAAGAWFQQRHGWKPPLRW